jgi:chemotaxis protein CheX
MKAEFINPFLMECQNIFREVAGMDIIYSGTTIKNSSVPVQDIAVLIGVTGDLKGYIVLNISEKFTKQIASNMMGGMEVSELNELSKSAVAELGNMIMGRVSTSLSEKKIRIDITPPSIMTGHNITLTTINKPLLSVKFLYANNDLYLDVSLTD